MAGRTRVLADERGITLQTLIVTAVLVLMAGAAGVVIIAITNSAQDDLENQSSDINARCQPWEIFDPTLEAAGRGGDPDGDGNGGLISSAIGCVRVCYVESLASSNSNTAPVLAAKIAYKVGSTTTYKDSDGGTVADANRWKLRLDRSNIASTGSPYIAVVTGDQAAGATAIALVGDNKRIEVSTNQRYCRVWDDSSDQEIASLRSD